MDIIGVVVGRFQTPRLHNGHTAVIEEAIRRHKVVVVFVGVTGGMPTKRNPLPFEVVSRMLTDRFPNIVVRPLIDRPDDFAWSRRLDDEIKTVAGDGGAMLYGGRDSFIAFYTGEFECFVIPEVSEKPATAYRESVTLPRRVSQGFREGMIYATRIRFPTAYQAVDIAIVRVETDEVLLGRKKSDNGMLRFPGGFVDPKDKTLEMAARRECREEVLEIETGLPRYLGSMNIADHRYRGSEDGVMTAFFVTNYMYGGPRAGDDLDGVEWVKIHNLKKFIVPNHAKLADILIQGWPEIREHKR